MKKTSLIIVLIIIILGLVAWWQFGDQKIVQVTNFEECIAAGNPVMLSYPRQCRHGDQTFIEDIEPVQTGDTPTSADNAPPGSLHNLPVPEAVAAVRTHVAGELGIDEGLVIVMSAFEREWPDSCLGLGGGNEACLQVITPGFEVTVQAKGQQFTYRTNELGTVLREE